MRKIGIVGACMSGVASLAIVILAGVVIHTVRESHHPGLVVVNPEGEASFLLWQLKICGRLALLALVGAACGLAGMVSRRRKTSGADA